MKHQMLSKVLLSTVVVMGSIAGSSFVMDGNAHAEQKK
ncbi:pathogenicity island protein [Staphylococcus aureus]|nr:pathogenicity island protein [Staphylococcus aureus]